MAEGQLNKNEMSRIALLFAIVLFFVACFARNVEGGTTLNVTNFTNGSQTNLSVMTDLELRPSDSQLQGVTTNGLVLRMNFAENQCGYDTSGLNQTVSNNNGATINHERCDFDGTDDYISVIGQNQTMNLSNFTFVTYIYHKSRPSGVDPHFVDEIASTFDGADAVGGWGTEIAPDGSYRITLNDGTKRSVDSLQDVNLNQWTALAYTFNGTRMQPYKDCVLGNGFTVAGFTPNGNSFQVARRTSGTYSYMFNGTIEYVWLYNRSLTVQELYPFCTATRFNTSNNTGVVYSGNFSGFALDSGQISANWTKYNWTGSLPSNTSILARVRVSEDNSTWGSFTSWSTSQNVALALTGRYLQYQFNLTSTLLNSTPVLTNFTATWEVPNFTRPTITILTPANNTLGEELIVEFTVVPGVYNNSNLTTNCSLIVDGVFAGSHASINTTETLTIQSNNTNNTVQQWRIDCTDYFGTVQSNTYTFYNQEGEDMILAAVIGAGIISALCLYFAFSLDSSHLPLKIIFIFASVLTLLSIPQAIVNSTDLTGVGLRLLRNMTWLFRVFFVYLGLYIIYELMKSTGKLPEWMQKRDGGN